LFCAGVDPPDSIAAPSRSTGRPRDPSPAQRELPARFIEADERCDATAAPAAAAEDIRVTMPSRPSEFRAVKLDVLRVEVDVIAGIITFGPALLDASACRRRSTAGPSCRRDLDDGVPVDEGEGTDH
jgi:hypothetical protein